MLLRTLLLIGIGLLTGTVTAISAGSGVTVVVPLLTIFLNYSIHEAIGTSLLVDVIASINVAYNYYRHGRVDLKAGAWLALGAVAGAQAGSHLAALVPQGGLKGGFSVFVILSGLSFLYRAYRKVKFTLRLNLKNPLAQTLAIVGIGVFTGLGTGMFGTGGGATLLVVLIYVMDFPIHTAIGTATAIMAAAATSGVVGFTLQGHIPWLDGSLIGLAAIVSGLAFSRIANRASEKALNIAVGSIFIAIGVAMFFVTGGTGVMQTVRAALQ